MPSLSSNPTTPGPRARLITWGQRAAVLLVLCALTFALYALVARLSLGEWAFPFDDPWIHQVYARNLAWYGQYAFNPGQPSTGSSAPLWTLLMVPAHWLDLSPVLWALGWGLLSLAGLGAVTWAWAEQRFAKPLPLALTSATLLTTQIAWAGVEGMETALVAALALLILWRLDRAGWRDGRSPFLDGLLNGLLLWLRPEAPLLTLVVAWQRRREHWQRLLAMAGGFLLLAIPYVALHWALSGQPLPQTVYAKVAYYGRPLTLPSLVAFLRDLMLIFAAGPWPLVALLLLPAIAQMARKREWPWGPGLAWAGLTVLLAALRLPVVLHFGRHFIPVLPPLLLASGEGLQALPRLWRQAALALGACLLLIGAYVGISIYIPNCQGILTSQVAMGRWVAAHLPPGTPVATHDIGAVGYFSEHPVVDTLALVTPELTPVVARRDTAALLEYLRQHNVHYLATLEELYAEIREGPNALIVVKLGRMELVELR